MNGQLSDWVMAAVCYYIFCSDLILPKLELLSNPGKLIHVEDGVQDKLCKLIWHIVVSSQSTMVVRMQQGFVDPRQENM